MSHHTAFYRDPPWRKARQVSPNSELRKTFEVEQSFIAHSSNARVVIGLAKR